MGFNETLYVIFCPWGIATHHYKQDRSGVRSFRRAICDISVYSINSTQCGRVLVGARCGVVHALRNLLTRYLCVSNAAYTLIWGNVNVSVQRSL